MSRSRIALSLGCIAVLGLIAGAIRADIPGPGPHIGLAPPLVPIPPPQKEEPKQAPSDPVVPTRVVIVPSQDAPAHLLLPPDFLARHKAALMKQQTIVPGGPALPTILAGLALMTAIIL